MRNLFGKETEISQFSVTLTWHDDLWDQDDSCLWTETPLLSSNNMASFGFRKLCLLSVFPSNKSKCDHNLLYFLTTQMAAMRDVSATETAIIYGLEPVWGAGFAWFLLGERWGATGWIGAALVLGKIFNPLALVRCYFLFFDCHT
jgi:hypothetical protein